MSRITFSFVIAMVVALIALGWASNHFRDKYLQSEKDRAAAEQVARERQSTINDMTHRQQLSAALDAKYTQELNDAKSQIDVLNADVAAGRRRLQLHAQCVPTTSTKTDTTRVDNAASPRLDDTAQRDYFTLRKRVTTMQKQLEGAQQWITEQCK